jgi:hypothetical protein
MFIPFKSLNHSYSKYENQLNHLWQRSVNSEYFILQLIDILKDLRGI